MAKLNDKKIMNLNKKKRFFKVKINHYYGKYYTISYAYYNWFPIFHTLKRFSELFFCKPWDEELWKYRDAIAKAKDFKTIEDIKLWCEIQEGKELRFLEAKKEKDAEF
jgi:hypothetical protein